MTDYGGERERAALAASSGFESNGNGAGQDGVNAETHTTAGDEGTDGHTSFSAPTHVEEPFLRFRLTYIDTVQSSPLDLPPPPTAEDDSTPFIPARKVPFTSSKSASFTIDRVPEIRIFGATEAGQRCCVHVHGVLPYVYVEYEGAVSPDAIHSYIKRLARAINECMAASLGRKDPAKSCFVAFIVPVKAVPFYGFHVGYRYFLKIYVLDPKFMTRLSTHLRSGAILRKQFIVYEAHIPYLLQFMLDANLYGCGWVDISKAKFREPVEESASVGSSADFSDASSGGGGAEQPMAAQTDANVTIMPRRKPKIYTRSTIPPPMLYENTEASPAKVSHSELEFDIHVSWILNRHLISERNLHADFTEYLHRPIPDDYKFVHSVRELWEDEKRRRQQNGLDGPMEVSENSAGDLLLGGLTAGTRSAPAGAGTGVVDPNDPDARMFGIGLQPPWKSFDENAAYFAALLEKDRAAYAVQYPNKPEPAFETFARKEKKGGWMEKIQTSFQSVEALFEETMERDEARGNPFGAWGIRGGVMGGTAAGAGTGATKREETTEPEVDPRYLARLRTKEGQAQLLRAENEDAMLDARVDNDFGVDEVNEQSDEEELAVEEDKRAVEERAKNLARKPGVSRQEALESVEAARELSEEMQAAGIYRDQNAPMGAQRPGPPRRSTTAESKERASVGEDEHAPVTEGSREASAATEGREQDEEDLALYRDVAMEDVDPDLALLDQLMPLGEPEPEYLGAGQDMDLRSSPPILAPNGLPAMTPASRLVDGDPVATSRAGTPVADLRTAAAPPLSEASKQRELLRQAGFGDLSQLDLDSDGLLDDSSPEKAIMDRRPDLVPEDRPAPSQSRWASGVYSPQKRKHADISPEKVSPFKLRATPAPVNKATSTSVPALSASLSKRPSPAKKNYFSPAKSKLRNAVVNPNFVAESRAKKNREEQMIGFHAIGEHGRTVLQGMLQPQVKARAKPKAKEPNVDDALPQNGAKHHRAEEDGPASKKARRSYSYSSSENEDEVGAWAHRNGEARMHIVLSSAEAAQPPIAHMESSDATSSAESEQAPESLADLPTQLVGSPPPASPDTSPPLPDSLDLPDSQGQHLAAGQTARSASKTDMPPEEDHNINLDLSNSPTRSFQVNGHHVQHPGQAGESETGLRPDLPRNVRFASILSERDGGNSSDAEAEEEEQGDGWEEDEEDSRDDAELSASPEVMLQPNGQESNRFEGALVGSEANEAAMPDHAAIITLTPSSSWPSSHKLPSSSQAPHGERRTYRLSVSAPTLYEILLDLDNHRLPHKIYQDAYWSNPTDLPAYTFEWAGRRYLHRSDADRFLPEFEHAARSKDRLSIPAAPVCFKRWQYAVPLPKRSAILGWKEGQEDTTTVQAPKVDRKGKALIMDTQWIQKSQVQGPTQANPYGAKYAQVKASNAVVKEKEHMSSLAIELHINTRGELLPDPAQDPIQAIFYCLQNEDDHIPDNGRKEGTHCGLIALNYETSNHDGIELNFRRMGLSRYTIDIVEDELELVNALVDRVREWDPEIFTGFDVLKDSWGYFVERVDEVFPGFDIVAELSRVRSQSTGKRGSKNDDRWGYSKGSTLKITGRHVLPVWRLLKSDINLCMYSFENVVFHLLRQRVPRFSHSTLTSWFLSGYPHLVRRVLQYRMLRAQLVIELLEEAEIVSRNAEFARVFGVDFHSVLTRGSQFKVESVMFKISKPENFMLPSPSREDVGRQNAAECMPLILEPESGFYSSPVLVFDFQSLYPSVMIAYNLCYSTCLGRIKEFMGTNRLGTASLAIQKGTLTLLKDHITISPNGMMFLKPGIRRSLISKMLTEILDTRVMIKKSMKLVKADDNALFKLLNARQLGLKFIANVTYGYTSATFSGRMPCVEVADAIVQTGRETLERAKHTIESRPDWGAIVRYGDTDSLFVHLPGKTKDEAFKIGNDIADTITKLNPKPVKLKFEKVYLPCFLLAKKRYVGFKYESQKDVEPVFDAKGIETVRRDGFPAMQKMLETCIKLMFRSADLSSVKLYVQQQFSRIMQNRASAQDFIYAKEVKMGSYSEKGTPPPGAVVTARRMLTDPRTEALYGERVPYVISKGLDGPQLQQAHRALTPEEFLSNGGNELDDAHYIGRVVKALNRLFNLVGVDVQEWYNTTPRRKLLGKPGQQTDTTRVRVDQHFGSLTCPICGGKKPSTAKLCSDCMADPVGTNLTAQTRRKRVEERVQAVASVCATCTSLPASEVDACDSIDCPTLYSRIKVNRELEDVSTVFADVEKVSQKQKDPYIIL